MPRRIPDYPDAYAGWNYVASVGSLVSLMSVVVLVWVFTTMLYHDPNKPKVKNNVWETQSYYSLDFNKPFDFTCFATNLDTYSKQNSSSLEFSIPTPAEYHSFTQAPIMG